MSQDDVLVKVEGVSKVFCRDLKKSLLYGAQDVLGELNPFSGRNGTENGGARKLRKGEFYAVKDVSFELKRGECLGLIGRNGAGKTTLLKMLNGLIKPDEGRIEMRGRVGALIALGAGFNPILTGRENVYVNGSVLGLTKKEIDAKFKEIVEFAEIGEFIDSPVQSYSSGMQVRLGFAVASTLKSDVLLLDEVLAVGDFKFRQKCLRRIAEILKDCAVVFVSHNFDQLERVCTRGLVLERGNCISDTNITKARQVYDELTENTKDKTGWIHECITIQNPDKTDIFHVNKDHIKLKIQLIVKEIEAEVVLRIRF
jgi:lipopolysaccharide transport system ATP-binding protein